MEGGMERGTVQAVEIVVRRGVSVGYSLVMREWIRMEEALGFTTGTWGWAEPAVNEAVWVLLPPDSSS